MAFTKRPAKQIQPTDPEHLYRILAASNPAAPPSLWLHQGDILRSWHGDHLPARDVAIELPTGAGKTLVGGLIADFQRRVGRERVAYLCPTRQLAVQVAERLASYGIPAVALTGPVKSWSQADRVRYTSAQAVAVTAYAHVFNSNPAIDDAQLLILDDAHAAADAVASPWSLSIRRDRQEQTYLDVLAVLRDALDPIVMSRMRDTAADGRYRSSTYLASPEGVRAAENELAQVLASAGVAGRLDTSAIHALRTVEDHLGHCLVYISYREILFRPLIPPTATHPAFDGPGRRVYMSATLGAGGELERAFGRRKIDRIPIPTGWERQGTGRRLFCVPDLTSDLSGEANAVAAFVKQEIVRHGRAVLLTPDERTASATAAGIVPTGTTILRADQVENDLGVFTNRDRAVLVLTNRYDGIDLPDDECRLVILDGLPAHGDLQERFLYSSLGAFEVLQERIRARIAQGAGRATRNARDYATVLVLGHNLITFMTRNDVRDAMHPELNAELGFGWNYSLDTTSSEMRDNIRVFLDHKEEWREIDQDIIAERDLLERRNPAGTDQLQDAVAAEVAAWQAVWQGEFLVALDHAKRVTDALRGGQASQRYAALWNYLAGCWAARLAETNQAMEVVADGYYAAARSAGRGTTWLSHLAAPADHRAAPDPDELDELDTLAVETILGRLGSVGRPAKFEPFVTAMRTNLAGTDSRPFEAGLVSLGTLLGAIESVGDGGADSAPDATWRFGGCTWVTVEAKSEASATGEVGSDSVRQAGSQLRYAAGQVNQAIPSGSFGILVTPEARVHPSAHQIAEPHVYLVRPALIRELADRAIRAWRAVRSAAGVDLAAAAQLIRAEQALPSQWILDLCAAPVAKSVRDGD